MNRSKSGEKKPVFDPGVDSSDDIEILEIVGVDEDGVSPVIPPPAQKAEAEDEAYVLDLDALPETDSTPADDEGDGLDEEGRLIRLQADFENFKKRVEREGEATRRHATTRLIGRLLPVLDNFERAVAAAPETEADRPFHEGVQLIFRQLLEELRREGLTAVEAVDKPFDPKVHEAVATEDNPDVPADTVTEEFQRGYLLHERLLRPALVKVSTRTSAKSEPRDREES